ncbi:phosphate ABC transporter membrane protein 1 (PhoT family) [Hydrogenispora ethanolica]|jgi:phosphate transport system permease protein|uniref:Phosphate transport system permease protein n=1 Tax=Hydrogenispora ethanolica TaxID=1082276 RepID=A0A4R1RU66_HYDET|nr:phosphate ABC transporter permease subunit PstC [Hydrogenispora ethanolica]TCL70101.1 phosphate ABC transporter membrane protein 1 (PhoT family) [Hydrogenispora ethanolica]
MEASEWIKKKEQIIRGVLFSIACAAVAGVLLIILFVFREGWPVLAKFGPWALAAGRDWQPTGGVYGMLPLLVGSCFVTLAALLLGVPLGVGCAVFMAEIAPERVARIVRPAVNLLAGIPSVVYGFFGLVTLVPAMRAVFGGIGFSLLAGGVILAIMILPTIISVSEDALRAVHRDYKEASLALGATHWQTIYKVLVPAARSGITAAIILGMGRALGETMAVIMVTGNTPLVAKSFLDPGPTLTGTIGQEWSYASGEHAKALFTVGIFLFVLIILINSTALIISRKKVRA